MTPARPTHQRARLATVRSLSAVGLVAATLTVADPAAAAPAPCERAEEYAAQSGAEVLHIDKLDGGGRGRISNVGLAQAKSALVASATVNSAAVTRLLDADRPGPFTEPLIQQAPPTNATPARRPTDGGGIGPFVLGAGVMTAHAQWDPRMACARTTGEATRAETEMHAAGIGDLLHVTHEMRGRSTTVLAAGGRTVATAAVGLTAFDLLDGAVHVKVVRPSTLTAQMSTKDDGDVSYQAAAVEVSGDGIRTTRLTGSRDAFEVALSDEIGARAESSTMETMTGGVPLPLPAIQGVPRLGAQESARVSGPGTRLRITLGNVRQATAGHAIAAKVTAIRIAITQAPPDPREAVQHTGASGADGYGGSDDRGRVVLDLGVGLLEAAAVAPEPRAGDVKGAVSAGGTGAGLPITGSPAGLVALGGAALVIAGAAALAFGTRRRRIRR